MQPRWSEEKEIACFQTHPIKKKSGWRLDQGEAGRSKARGVRVGWCKEEAVVELWPRGGGSVKEEIKDREETYEREEREEKG